MVYVLEFDSSLKLATNLETRLQVTVQSEERRIIMASKRFQQPWQHDSELALLRDDFYPDSAKPNPYAPSTDRRVQAVDTVGRYVFRNPNTPHALVATADLTEATLQEELLRQNKVFSDSLPRRNYGLAFVKFVNGFVDRDTAASNASGLLSAQEPVTANIVDEDPSESDENNSSAARIKVKGGGEGSMYAHAAKIDMPEDFVALRHSIVHGDVPSLPTLQNYNERALQWLWEKWWQKNALGDPAQAREEEEAELEQAELGRERSMEVWRQYATDRGPGLEGEDEAAQGRRRWMDRRMQLALG